jgi:tetratricopeptide (TPR) repeat protein
MMMQKRMLALCAIFCLLPIGAIAEALLKPLPNPDMTKSPPAVAKHLTETRADFDKAKVGLVGDQLVGAYALMGAEYARAGFNDVAAVAFYDASQLAPKDGRWLYLRGVIARVQKNNADARANFEAALVLDQGYLPIRYRLADTLVDLGDLEAARKVLEPATTQFKDQAPLFAMLGRIALKQKRYADAIDNLNQALKIDPAANAIYADLAAAYAAQGNADLAKSAQAKVGQDQPSIADPLVANLYNSGPPPVSGTPLEQVRQLAARGQYPAARAKLDDLLKAKADDVETLALAARIDALLGKHAIAQDEAARALKLEPNSASANLSQGLVYEFAGDDTNAYTYYQRAAHADPKLADAQLLLGNAEMRRGHYVEASEHYRQLASLGPESIETTSRLVAAQVAAGHCADALARVNGLLTKRAQDGDLMQLFVRLASTCPAAQAQERTMAFDYAKALYKQRPNATDSTALALANAAQGKFDEAQKYQAEAIYEVVRLGNKPLADMYRTTMRQFAAQQVPDRPWPPEHPYFKPPMLASVPVEPATPQKPATK